MRWAIMAPFFLDQGHSDTWIDDFERSGRHRYRKLPVVRSDKPVNWHSRRKRATPLAGWLAYWRQARSGWDAGCDGLITVFPQLAMMAAVQKFLAAGRRKTPLVAWCFNVGERPSWVYTRLARVFLRQVDRFVVHSRGEITTLHRWFGIPAEKIRFLPLQRAPIPITASEDAENPFVLAMGSANRDYATLVAAMRVSPMRLMLIASPRSLAGIAMPDNVEVANGLTAQECRVLAQRARINIVPLADVATASGQVTIVEALRLGRPLIATRGVGSIDYIVDGENALLVEAGDAADLARAINRLWNDAALRETLARNAAAYAEAHFSDEAAAKGLAAVLDELSG